MATERSLITVDGVVHFDAADETYLTPEGSVNGNIEAAGGLTIEVPRGLVEHTGQVPTVVVSANITIEVPRGLVQHTGQVPTVVLSEDLEIEVPAGLVEHIGQVPTLIYGLATTITVVGITGGADLTALSYVVFDGADIGVGSVIKQGNNETTDSNGDLVIDITGLGVALGTTLTIVITDYTTTPGTANRAAVCYANAA